MFERRAPRQTHFHGLLHAVVSVRIRPYTGFYAVLYVLESWVHAEFQSDREQFESNHPPWGIGSDV
jgi:hypothetical protein